jgi:hypothetical protein
MQILISPSSASSIQSDIPLFLFTGGVDALSKSLLSGIVDSSNVGDGIK